ncbi:MAG: GTP 3',8-cyclase MoaA, partial [Bacteroidetes bacterium]|nr:GTP 3',8-cyclase MoaA [Bacteroidota bacterium]
MLTDKFGRVHDYLRISLTESCNLRCKYCMPEDYVFPDALPFRYMTSDEIMKLSNVFVQHGVNKIRLTGGEPLVRKDVKTIIDSLSKIHVLGSEESLKLTLTTNGILAHNYINEFKQAKIESINMSLDTLIPERFEAITHRNYFHKVMANVHLLLQHNFHVKLNVVVMKGVNDDEITDFVQLTRDYPLHVRFIEFMPFSGNEWNKNKLVSFNEMLNQITHFYEIMPLENQKHDTAKKYKVLGHEGTFAFINTMSEPFCGDCNRMRLTADGKLKNCLFSKGEIDLLTPLRNDEDINQLI